jgi:hypothetical protein
MPAVWRVPLAVGGCIGVAFAIYRSLDVITARSYGIVVRTEKTSFELKPPERQHP